MSILINGLDMPSDDGELVEVLIFGDGHVVQTGDSFKAEDGRFYYKTCDWKYLTAVPVVRCKDCRWYHDSMNCSMYSEGMHTPPGWYCADGRRKEQCTQ